MLKKLLSFTCERKNAKRDRLESARPELSEDTIIVEAKLNLNVDNNKEEEKKEENQNEMCSSESRSNDIELIDRLNMTEVFFTPNYYKRRQPEVFGGSLRHGRIRRVDSKGRRSRLVQIEPTNSVSPQQCKFDK
ncbi:unnamed protein product [Caenorhabditis angaria]|uniref:Uncharacterized protein n=1 Tax=Caenorhabditis angaria TaxID=860376 RepID=A0A9P1N4J6_9PELO|nr:unnamed protein product [Caenorhabditis angaria]